MIAVIVVQVISPRHYRRYSLTLHGATSHRSIIRDAEEFLDFNGNFKPEEHTIELAAGRKTYAAKQRGTDKMEHYGCKRPLM